MTSQTRRIIACIDGSSITEQICDYASWVARKSQVSLMLLNVFHEQDDLPSVEDLGVAEGLGASRSLIDHLDDAELERKDLMVHASSDILDAARQNMLAKTAQHVEVLQLNGNLKKNLLKLEPNIELCVVGKKDYHAGSQSKATIEHIATIVRALHSPILVVNGEFNPPEKIMIAYDGSQSANKALHYVCHTPLFKDATCHLVNVISEGHPLETQMKEAESQLQGAGISVISSFLKGKVAEQLNHYTSSHSLDLIIMGAFSHNRIRDMLLGSLTIKMLEISQSPLLLVR